MFVKKCSFQVVLDQMTEEQIAGIPDSGRRSKQNYFESIGFPFYSSSYYRHQKNNCLCSHRLQDFVNKSIAKVNNELNVLIFDIERSAGCVKKRFFSRGDLKDSYIFFDDVVEEPKTVVFSYKWYGTDDVTTIAEWQYKTRKDFAQAIYDVVSKADVWVAHNGNRADFPWIKETLWVEFDFPPMPKVRKIDTMTLAREIGFVFKSLNDISKRLGYVGKIDKYSISRMDAALAGDKVERALMEAYCGGDVEALEQIFSYMIIRSDKPFNLNPVRSLIEVICERCGSDDMQKVGYVIPSRLIYKQYQCQNCKAYQRARKAEKVRLDV